MEPVSSKTPTLRIQHLEFKNHPFFEDASVDLGAADSVVIVGENGTGKSYIGELVGFDRRARQTRFNIDPAPRKTLSDSSDEGIYLRIRFQSIVSVVENLFHKERNPGTKGELDSILRKLRVDESTFGAKCFLVRVGALYNDTRVMIGQKWVIISLRNCFVGERIGKEFQFGLTPVEYLLYHNLDSADKIERFGELNVRKHTFDEREKTEFGELIAFGGFQNLKARAQLLKDIVKDLDSPSISGYIDRIFPALQVEVERLQEKGPGNWPIGFADLAPSDGERFVLGLVSNLIAYRYSIVFLDEPEASLHPSLQMKFPTILENMEKILGYSPQVFVSTHSPYIIAAFQLSGSKLVTLKRMPGSERVSIDQKHFDFEVSVSKILNDVLGFPNVEYHDELYSRIQELDSGRLKGSDKKWIDRREFERGKQRSNGESSDDEIMACIARDVSLHTYIRHSFHHRENTLNPGYTKQELVESIGRMEGVLSEMDDPMFQCG